jgi:predicted HicB family RNase H-like nuclease
VADTIYTTLRGIPKDVHRTLRIKAAKQHISVNQLILNILTKEAKKLEKKVK